MNREETRTRVHRGEREHRSRTHVDHQHARMSADTPRPPLVFVVDDDGAIRRLLRLTLVDHGFEVRTASNGRNALDQLDSDSPDVIVLDLEMPEMDGRSFFRELRGRGYATPVVILSAHGAARARRELAAEAALDKPFRIEDLVETLRRVT